MKNMKKKALQLDAYALLFIVLFIVALLTYIIPAGSFQREMTESGTSIVIPESYERIEQHPVKFFDIFLSIQEGLIGASGMIFLVLIIGGTFHVIEKTGAIHSLIMKTIEKTKNKEWLLITIVAGLLSVLGGFGIVNISVIAFVPIGIRLAQGMKMDAIVGVAIMYLGAYSGFAIGFMDPIRTGFAQSIAQLPKFSGIEERLVLYGIIVLVTILYIIWYADRVKKNPEVSILRSNPFPKLEDSVQDESVNITLTHKLVILILALGIGLYIYGVFKYQWDTNEMAAMFLLIAIGAGIVARMGSNELVKTFVEGCKKIFYGAAIIGLARAIVIVMSDGQILDTIVHGIYTGIQFFPSTLGAIAMLIVNGLFNFIVSSGTAHAAIIMPIMSPLSDLMGISRQVAVQAYTMGDGFTNVINPLSGTLMAILAISGIPLGKWLRFALPLVLIWFVIGILFMIYAVATGWA